MAQKSPQYIEEAVDLRVKRMPSPKPKQIDLWLGSSSRSTTPDSAKGQGSKAKRPLNVFKKHKLKYRYLLNKKSIYDRRQSQDSGQYGSSSMNTSSSGSGFGKNGSGQSISQSDSSSSPSSGASGSPVANENEQQSGQQKNQAMSMVMNNVVPLIVMMQGQIGNNNSSGTMQYSNALLFKCNMCDMFSNNLRDVLSHVGTQHSSVHYCFLCNRFHNSQSDLERHKRMCETAHQAFQRIVDGHYHDQTGENQDIALNLTVAGSVAMRAAQILHNRKGRHSKIKKLLKCTYCKKAFFGRFYLQRHLRSHTGEKVCFCNTCGKGFVEWRNLRNHLSRFHNSSGNSEETLSPNITSSDSETMNGKPSQQGQQQETEFTVTEGVPSVSATDQPVASLTQTNNLTEQISEGHQATSHCTSQPYVQSNHDTCPNMPPSSVNAKGTTQQDDEVSYCSNVVNSKESIEQQDDDSGGSVSTASTMHLGSTSSRLSITQDETFMEESLNPICTTAGEKIYTCRSCDKTFRTKFAMQRHLDFHADKRPFQCDQCSYKAKTKPQLKVHLKRHTGEKGYHCDLCSYSCVTHSDLNRHCKSRSHMFRVALHDRKHESTNPTENTATDFSIPKPSLSKDSTNNMEKK